MVRLIVLTAHAPMLTVKKFLKDISNQKDAELLAMTVFSHPDGRLEISGCEVIKEILALQNSFSDPATDGSKLFELILMHVKKTYHLPPERIYHLCEINLGISAGPELSSLAINFVNKICAGTLVYYSGTLAARQFAHGWLRHYRCPAFGLLMDAELVHAQDLEVSAEVCSKLSHINYYHLKLMAPGLPYTAILDKEMQFFSGVERLLSSFRNIVEQRYDAPVTVKPKPKFKLPSFHVNFSVFSMGVVGVRLFSAPRYLPGQYSQKRDATGLGVLHSSKMTKPRRIEVQQAVTTAVLSDETVSGVVIKRS